MTAPNRLLRHISGGLVLATVFLAAPAGPARAAADEHPIFRYRRFLWIGP